MARRPTPLIRDVPIVNADGTPTERFLNWLQGQLKLNSDADAVVESTITGGTALTATGTFPGDTVLNLDDTAVTPGTYGDAANIPVVTIDQQGRITLASETALTSGVGDWAQAGLWDFAISGATATPIAFTGLAGAAEILIIASNLTRSVAATTTVQVSDDNGATYKTTGGDYITADEGGGGADVTAAAIAFLTASGAARSSVIHIKTAKLNPQACVNGAGNHTHVVVALGAINAIQVVATGGGNFTGGTLRVYTR